MRFTKKLTLKNIFFVLLIWRLLFFIPQWWGIANLHLQTNYLGGGLANYLSNPYLWSWANFDGEHYLAIARFGYRPLTYFFFPLYPTTLKIIGTILGKTEQSFILTGLVISLISLFLAIVYLIKLLKLDYKDALIKNVIITILLFPTAFYFVAVYTESLFLLFIVLSFYYARKGNWWLAGIFGGLSSATRLAGIIMLPALLVEFYGQRKKNFLALALIPLGLFLYMFYLNSKTGDFLAFFHSVEIFGEQRSAYLVILPQVFFRYIFRILPNLSWNYFPQIFTTLLEFGVGTLFLFTCIYSVFKLRLSYTIFLIGGYILPTLSGSFSSMPRYALILFPAFIIFAQLCSKVRKEYIYLVYCVLLVLLLIATSFFTRGFWVS